MRAAAVRERRADGPRPALPYGRGSHGSSQSISDGGGGIWGVERLCPEIPPSGCELVGMTIRGILPRHEAHPSHPTVASPGSSRSRFAVPRRPAFSSWADASTITSGARREPRQVIDPHGAQQGASRWTARTVEYWTARSPGACVHQQAQEPGGDLFSTSSGRAAGPTSGSAAVARLGRQAGRGVGDELPRLRGVGPAGRPQPRRPRRHGDYDELAEDRRQAAGFRAGGQLRHDRGPVRRRPAAGQGLILQKPCR